MISNLTDQISTLQPGAHLCLVYEKDPVEQMPALIPFIQDALSTGEQFIYVADDQTVEQLSTRLEQAGVDVGKETDRGSLKLWTRQQWRQPGELSSELKSLQVRQFMDAAAQAGFRGIRFAIEMTWILGPDIDASKLEHWEATINRVLRPDFPARVVCQYNRSRLSTEVMLAALRTHPSVILCDHVQPNLFYEAPLILDQTDNSNATAHKVEWKLSQLKQAGIAKKEREAAIHQDAVEARARLAAIVESSDDAIVAKDLNGIITSWNAAAQTLFGYKAGEAIGRPVSILIPPDHSNEEPKILAKLRRGEKIQHYETVRRAKDGRRIDVSLSVSPIRNANGKIIGASKIARDITKRKQIEADLESWQRELESRVRERTAELASAHKRVQAEIDERKRLETEVSRVVEREQLRLGQELHDGLGQELTAIRFMMSALQMKLEQVAPTTVPEAAKVLDMVAHSVEQARILAKGFYPVELEKHGLLVALEELARRTQQSFKLSCAVESDGSRSDELKGTLAIQLFRIVQEAVHNAVKHACAKHIVVRLGTINDNITITIEDDGIGLPTDVEQNKGMGLRIMQYRARMVGGKLSCAQGPRKGVLLTCSVPAEGSGP